MLVLALTVAGLSGLWLVLVGGIVELCFLLACAWRAG